MKRENDLEFIVLSKKILQDIGVKEAVIHGYLANQYTYHLRNGTLDDEGYFYTLVKDIEKYTGIKKKRQLSAIQTLSQYGYLKYKYDTVYGTRKIKVTKYWGGAKMALGWGQNGPRVGSKWPPNQ